MKSDCSEICPGADVEGFAGNNKAILCTVVLFTVDKFTPQYDPWLSMCGISITATRNRSEHIQACT